MTRRGRQWRQDRPGQCSRTPPVPPRDRGQYLAWHTQLHRRGKAFAHCLLNHHGDGRVTLWLGTLAWKRGRKTFVSVLYRNGRMKLLFWVGIEQQALLTEDPRYAIPVSCGSGGWIELDMQEHIHWEEVESLLEGSCRHFALKCMLRALDGRPSTEGAERRPLRMKVGEEGWPGGYNAPGHAPQRIDNGVDSGQLKYR